MGLEFLFFIALWFYTVAIVANQVLRRLDQPMMVIFGAGLLMDTFGTVFLCALHAQGWQWNAHSISGLSAWLIMAIHFVWAVTAYKGRQGSTNKFHQYSPAAWLIWLIAFVTGIPMSIVQRIGLLLIIVAVTSLTGLAWSILAQSDTSEE